MNQRDQNQGSGRRGGRQQESSSSGRQQGGRYGRSLAQDESSTREDRGEQFFHGPTGRVFEVTADYRDACAGLFSTGLVSSAGYSDRLLAHLREPRAHCSDRTP